MESRAIKILAPMNKKIALRVIPGHFATNNSHINLYIDLTTMKTRQKEAEEAAQVIAAQYKNNVVVDTIVCLEGCEVIGAFLAQELSNAGIHSMNAHQTIYIIAPEFNTNGQMMFRVNNQPAVYGKHILLLSGSATTGDTLKKAVECIRYYGGIAEGIAAVFSAIGSIDGIRVNSIFQPKHLPEYKSYAIDECPLCKAKQRLDAIVDGYGYLKL
ncbi:MAG TPA: orotate phosphoribosyltransferase [Lachnospiraceae bacterium]|nr:orotate phosphoribosyltransferase [Lachnospiraceae bacterium]HBY70791.1 orotate phosphoribosyltransferase [Lachnospiraceae bacterium]HCA70301.1 orotate phosphoribosyltransferase [Lachnospiraceae bacterium]HCR40519.1 orotate phosphoribosyltransferase [Lachnospiraceae bacterium]